MAGVLLGLWLHSGASSAGLNAAFISVTALGMLVGNIAAAAFVDRVGRRPPPQCFRRARSEEHTSGLQSLMRISYAVFCLKKKNYDIKETHIAHSQDHNNIDFYLSLLLHLSITRIE